MTEAELTDPALAVKRHRLDMAKLVLSGVAATAATAALVVSLLALLAVGKVTNSISDCTTPGGACYQQQQQSTQEARIRLVNANVATQWCARTEASLDGLQSCVTRVLGLLGDR